MQVEEHRPSAGQGLVYHRLVPLVGMPGKRSQAQQYAGRGVHQQDVLDVVLAGKNAQAAEQVVAVCAGGCGQEGGDGPDQVGVLLQGGGIFQLVGAPFADLVGLEPGDGGQLPLDLEAHGLGLGAVQPHPAGYNRQQGEHEPGLHPSRKHLHLQVGLLVILPPARRPGVPCICIETGNRSTKIWPPPARAGC